MNTTKKTITIIITDGFFNVLGSTVGSCATLPLVVNTVENGALSVVESVMLDGVVYLLGN